jgi:hypothetical protein
MEGPGALAEADGADPHPPAFFGLWPRIADDAESERPRLVAVPVRAAPATAGRDAGQPSP